LKTGSRPPEGSLWSSPLFKSISEIYDCPIENQKSSLLEHIAGVGLVLLAIVLWSFALLNAPESHPYVASTTAVLFFWASFLSLFLGLTLIFVKGTKKIEKSLAILGLLSLPTFFFGAFVAEISPVWLLAVIVAEIISFGYIYSRGYQVSFGVALRKIVLMATTVIGLPLACLLLVLYGVRNDFKIPNSIIYLYLIVSVFSPSFFFRKEKIFIKIGLFIGTVIVFGAAFVFLLGFDGGCPYGDWLRDYFAKCAPRPLHN